MSFLLLIQGIFLKLLTGADDTATHAPVISSLTQTKKGKLAFLFGMFFSVIFILILAFLFADFVISILYKNIVAAVVLVFLALMVYFDIFLQIQR